MGISAKEAAALVGMTKQGIISAIHKGKLSATRNTSGQFEIDPVELFRVYEPVSTTVKSEPEVADNLTPDQGDKVSMLERIIRDKDEVIADLRQRLDAEAEERRKLTHILTDKQRQEPSTPPVNWWQRLFGRMV